MTIDENGVACEADRPSPITIKTFTGRYVDPFQFQPTDVAIEDIAHHLSNICRYQGATATFYSVAEHCLYVSAMIERFHGAPHLALAGLLHDAAETYLGDIPRPLKHRPEFAFYRSAELDIVSVVCEVFGIPYRDMDDPVVHQVDRDILPYEMVMLRDTARVPRPSTEVEQAFLARFYQLQERMARP